MLGNLGWQEVLVLAVLGLIVFGPDRLPKAASDAARMLRELRSMARGAATDLKAELGPEFAELDIRGMHPRNLVQGIFDDDVPPQKTREPVLLAPDERPPYDADAT